MTNQSSGKDNKWYLVQCKPKESFRAEMNLRNQGYHCFHPTYPVKKKKLGFVYTDISPLFPFYIFVLLNNDSNWSVIRSTRGVSRLVSFNSIPASVDQSIIDGISYHCAKLHSEKPENLFKQGDRVLITEGCFRELEAIVAASTGEERVILLLNLFNRQQRIDLPVHMIKSCG